MRRVPLHLLFEIVTLLIVLVGLFVAADEVEATTRDVAPGDDEHALARPMLAELGAITPPRAAPTSMRRRASPRPRPVTPPSSAVCSPDDPPRCRAASDCTGPVPEGARWTCVQPWWAVESTARKFLSARVAKDVATTKVCAFGWAPGVAVPGRHPGPGTWRRQGQARTQQELELVVRTQCRARHGCDADTLARWLGALAVRESSLRPWVTHRLSGDERANSSAWAKMKATYAANPHYADAERWRGRGLLGQIAAYHLHTIDPLAAPEELCDVSFATIAYLQRARSAASKQRSLGLDPSYASVAAAVGTGAIRPSPRALKLVRARLRRAGVEPDARVSADDFGTPLPAGGPGKGGWAAVTAARSVVAALRVSRRVLRPSS